MRDPRHGRTLPAARDLARVVHAFLINAGERWRPGANLADLAPVMMEAVGPFLTRYYLIAALRTERAIRLAVEMRRRRRKAFAGLRTKAGEFDYLTPQPVPTMFGAFNFLLPQVRETLRRMTFAFCAETLATASVDADTAYRRTREELTAGVEAGESVRDLRDRVMDVFRDRRRALRIAQTEASRSMNAGEMEAARQTGFVKKMEWLASDGACPRCEKLDGQERQIGEPFYIDPKGGPYAVVMHPPLHPNCYCMTNPVLE